MVDSSCILELELIDGLGEVKKRGQSEMNPCVWHSHAQNDWVWGGERSRTLI